MPSAPGHSNSFPPQKFLIYGKSGWIGGLLGEELSKLGYKYEYGEARLENREAILRDIERVRDA